MQKQGSILDRFNVALVTGGGGGLGKALAANLIRNGKQVIIAGRTESNLQECQKELGLNCIAYYVVDLTNISTLSDFAVKITKEHPELDCVINNAGIQKPLDFTKEINTQDIHDEINTNIVSLVLLCTHFSKHLQSKSSAVIMNVASGLAYVPISPVPVYCATKAFVKSFTQSLRVQFKDTSVTVVELSPPLVESDLHRDHANSESYKNGNNKMALTQDQFISEVEQGWKEGSQEVGAGMALKNQAKWRETFEPGWKMMNGLNK